MGSVVSVPSVGWREVVGADEAERHRRQGELFVAMQARKSDKYGNGRALHRKQVAALRATLTVPGDLPEYARQGLFRVPDKYDVWVRLSNGGFNRAADVVPDIRGFSLKVLGVSGPGALGGEAVSQDFALINHERFSSATSEEFSTIVTTAGQTKGQLLGSLIKKPALIPRLKAVATALKEPFSGFATQDFFSAAPISFGPYAARVRLRALAGYPNPGADDWAADVYDRLAGDPLDYDVQVQFFVDEQSTPIEDASVAWAAPYETVGRLTIGRQKPDEEFAAEVEAAVFDPWNAKAEHRPLGEVMRARKVAYFASQQHRNAT
ncbi:catalase family protein [Kribbella endophytica]